MFFFAENETGQEVRFPIKAIRSEVLRLSSGPSELRIISNVDPTFHFVPIIDDDDCEHFLLKMLS